MLFKIYKAYGITEYENRHGDTTCILPSLQNKATLMLRITKERLLKLELRALQGTKMNTAYRSTPWWSSRTNYILKADTPMWWINYLLKYQKQNGRKFVWHKIRRQYRKRYRSPFYLSVCL